MSPSSRDGRPGLADLCFPPTPSPAWGAWTSSVLVFLGALGAFAWIRSPLDTTAVVVAALATTLAYRIAALRPRGRAAQRAVLAVRVAVVLLWVGWGILVVAFGSALSWTVPAWGRVLLAALVVAALASRARRAPVRVPLLLPVGAWILACIVGWAREDGRVACDDYLRAAAQPGVEVVVPVHSAARSCEPGRTLRPNRTMRRVWEAPGGDRLVFTTQPGIMGSWPGDAPLPVELSGSICEVHPGRDDVQCVGRGKSEGIVESAADDRLYVATWGGGAAGSEGGAVYAFAREGSLKEPLAEIDLDLPSVHMFLDPLTDTLGVLFDRGVGMLPLRASDLSRNAPLVELPLCAADVYYDAERGEGLICYSPSLALSLRGEAAAVVAFTGRPFAARGLATSRDYPWMWLSAVWGCGFDPVARKAWAAIADLGLLLRLDYDTGRIEQARFLGFGMRAMVVDGARNRLYVARFLSGEVLALDRDTGTEVGRWFGGRFVRGLRLSRDGRSLWVGSNVGVLRIALDD